jgi:uncharacterized protein (TIGR00725 family)
MTTERPVYVAVVGGYQADPAVTEMAEEVGALLAARGAIVVTGGREGVAAAASKGAAEAGGVTVGLLPGRDRSEANPWVTVVVVTGLGETRNALVAMNGDVVIAFDGAFGTLSEIAHARNNGTAVVAVGEWMVSPLGAGASDVVLRAATPAEAVEIALRAASTTDLPG